MSKMSELDAAIRDLRTAAVAINDAADTLSEMFSGETAEAPAKPTEPVPTKEDVRAILAEMSSRGFTAQVKELLRQHGAATLSGQRLRRRGNGCPQPVRAQAQDGSGHSV